MKTCPFCAEQIQDAAIVCRYCHANVESSPDAVPVQQQARTDTAPKTGEPTSTPPSAQPKHPAYLVLYIGMFLIIYGGFSVYTASDAKDTMVRSGLGSHQILDVESEKGWSKIKWGVAVLVVGALLSRVPIPKA